MIILHQWKDPRWPNRKGYRVLAQCPYCTTIRSGFMSTIIKRDSCGCMRYAAVGIRAPKHGHARHSLVNGGTPTYRTWTRMIQRCTYPKVRNWDRYGGRGIKVCDRWRGPDGYTNFLADMGPKPDGLPRQWSLDRIDNDGNYEPQNCRWADRNTQVHNKSLNRFVSYEGENLILADWNKRFGLSKAAIFLKARELGSYEAAIAHYALHGKSPHRRSHVIRRGNDGGG
jgi:hypothetical protein